MHSTSFHCPSSITKCIAQLIVAVLFGGCIGESAKNSSPVPKHAQGCEEDWNKLLALDISANDKEISGQVAYPKKAVITADDDGYVLVKPAGSVKSTHRQADGQLNSYSFWAFFKCNKNDHKLVHDHCRVGEKGEKHGLMVPLSKVFRTDEEPGDDKYYACRKSNVDAMNAVILPITTNDPSLRTNGMFLCNRMEGSPWCGMPSAIHDKGCGDDWNALQKGYRTYADSKIELPSSIEKYKDYTVELKLSCENAKLTVQGCNSPIESGLKIAPGFYKKTYDTVWGCPGKSLHTPAEIAAAVVFEMFTPGNPIKPPKGLKPTLPSGMDESCAKGWETLTDGGRWIDDDFVQIVAKVVLSTPAGFSEEDVSKGNGQDLRTYSKPLWVRFACDRSAGKLKLDHCRLGDSTKILPGKALKGEDGFFYNCGSVAETNPGNVKEVVSRSKTKAKGLTDQ